MLLGKIIGTVWATQKVPSLEGMQLEIVRAMDWEGKLLSNFVIAVNAVGAGVGETVLVAQGSSARQSEVTKDKPVDAVIMAIVDNYDVYPHEELAKQYAQREKPILEKVQQVKEV